ncbi:MAG: DUF4178 domain-containing protein [Pseudomonadota bacterium]|nr:DUF4178 domain-containing protein [Pseudomonadota bacterium]
MISSSCPSCGSPLTFRSGAALTAVCAACQSCVVREGDLLRDYGKVARFQRDLSPIQLDARGNLDGRGFRVAGVLRKARVGVRWNEWYLTFDDGGDGWIGEGNGQWFAYGERVEVPMSQLRGGRPGRTIAVGDAEWSVMEDAEAAVVAAEGSLPFPVAPNERGRYLDLREVGGARVATLDFADDPPVLWLGRDITLVQLQMEGLRAFAGWSDPVLVQFAGPEVTAVRALRCPQCGGTLELHAPGDTQRVGCPSCGAVVGVDAEGDLATAALIARAEKAVIKPALPLGARGTLRGVDWVVIGAMVRFVVDEGEWSWTEYLLHNPYRGFVWLVDDTQRHWSFVEPLRGELPRGEGNVVRAKGRTFRKFQTGDAFVRHVLGEFTWEVAAGDRAWTADYVDPPHMLSAERTDNEVTWSLGTWLPAAEVASAFKVKLPTPTGVAPHQPNPAKNAAAIARAIVRGSLLLAAAAVLLALAFVLPAREKVMAHEYLVVPGENAWVTSPLRLDEPANVDFTLDSTLLSSPDMLVSFIHEGTGEVWDWTTYGDATATARLAAGTWNGRVALAVPATEADAGRLLKLAAVRDPGWALPAILLFVYALCAPILYFVDISSFEQRRWAQSSTGQGGS